MINNDPRQNAMRMSPYHSLGVPNVSNYNGAESLGVQSPNPVYKINELQKSQEIPKTIEIKPKALETFTQGIGSKLNIWA